MTPDTSAVQKYFYKLGLEPEIADIYLALQIVGPQTISQLSRSAGIERTRIYRLIDQLLASNLIELEAPASPASNRGIIKAAPIANLRILVAKKEQELQALQDELPLIEQLLNRDSVSSPITRVQLYSDMEGIKQMLWHETQAASEVLMILSDTRPARFEQLDGQFYERWVVACNEANIHFRDILASKRTSNAQTTPYAPQLTHWQTRTINSTDYVISHNMVTYDNVVVHYNRHGGTTYGMEIHNADIAAAQRAVFELLWLRSQQQPGSLNEHG